MRIALIITILLFYSCKPNTIKVEIIPCEITLDEEGKIGGSRYNTETSKRSNTNTSDAIAKFDALYEKVNEDKRYKCIGNDYVIVFKKSGNNTERMLYVNTIDGAEKQVFVTSSDHNGYQIISKQEWLDLVELTK